MIFRTVVYTQMHASIASSKCTFAFEEAIMYDSTDLNRKHEQKRIPSVAPGPCDVLGTSCVLFRRLRALRCLLLLLRELVLF